MNDLPNGTNYADSGFSPKYRCVESSDDCQGLYACIAMIVGGTLEEVRQTALAISNPLAHGLWSPTEQSVTDLLAHYGGWRCSQYARVEAISKLPDLALIVTAKDAGTQGGHTKHCLFHRQRPAPGRPGVEYVVDPSRATSPDQRIRFDVANVEPFYYMHIYWMQFSDDF